MEITKATIRYFKIGGFRDVQAEGTRNVKVLPFLSVVQAEEGYYEIALGSGEAERTCEGGFFIAPAHVNQTIVHRVNEKTGKMTARWLFLDVRINDAYSIDELFRFPAVLNGEEKRALNALFDRLFGTEDVLEKTGLCYQVLALLVKTAVPRDPTRKNGVERAVEYITEHYKSPVDAGRLAREARMSKSRFFALFKRQTGASPISYLNRYRLSLAAEMLADSEDAIGEIGRKVGWSDALYFSKCFKKTYGVSPLRYRLAKKKSK